MDRDSGHMLRSLSYYQECYLMDDSPSRREFLPFSLPTISDREIDEVVDSLQSGWITTGPKVARFEQAFSEWSNGAEAISVNSATAGLHLALSCLDLKTGDEIITTPITWPSTINNIELCGATPVFADVDRHTLQIDPDAAEAMITPRTKAIIPVHFAGAPCNLDRLHEICSRHGIYLIEDAAHAVGTEYAGKLIGTDSQAAVFSFHPIKNITTGEGGMVLTNNNQWASRMRRLRFHGISRDAWKRYSKGGVPQYEVEEPGYKYNMLDIQAAIGIHQFAWLGKFNRIRRELAMNYNRLLSDIPEIMPLSNVPWPHLHAWHLYVVRLDIDSLKVDRDQFISALQQENIGIGLHFPAVHLQKYYREKYGFTRGQLPNAEWNSDRLFSIPLYPMLTAADQADVITALKKLITRFKI